MMSETETVTAGSPEDPIAHDGASTFSTWRLR